MKRTVPNVTRGRSAEDIIFMPVGQIARPLEVSVGKLLAEVGVVDVVGVDEVKDLG